MGDKKSTVQEIWTGTDGEIWLNNTDRLGNVQKFSLKQTNKYEDVDDTDNFATKKRLVGVELTGELTKFKTDFAFKEIMTKYKNKTQSEISLTGSWTNNDTGETKRISITGITLDGMDIFAFEKGKVSQDNLTYSATDYDFI